MFIRACVDLFLWGNLTIWIGDRSPLAAQGLKPGGSFGSYGTSELVPCYEESESAGSRRYEFCFAIFARRAGRIPKFRDRDRPYDS